MRKKLVLQPIPAMLGVVFAWPLHAQTLNEIVVSGSQKEQQSFDVPAAVQAIDQQVIQLAGPQVNLSESLNRVPGITVLNRQNYAQDLQLSIRGSGARAPFGIRGVRLIVDGIPATMPDGQGQASTISLPSAQRIEVLRGPLAQLYGNSSAGVVQVFTADGTTPAELRTSVDSGSDGLLRLGAQAAGESKGIRYVVDHSDFRTDGWRAHSAAQRQHTNAKLATRISDETQLTVVANVFNQPVSQDPLGLTRLQLETDARQTDQRATDFQTGKEVSQQQVGVVLDHKFDKDRTAMLRWYTGRRDLDNRLAIPLSTQRGATSAGGIVDLDRSYEGLGLRYSQGSDLGGGRITYSLGFEWERMAEHRQGFLNDGGVRGELKRDEDNRVQSAGLIGQAEWLINEHWSALAGLRVNRVGFEVKDRYIRTGNPDDSGVVRFASTNPVLGLTRHLDDNTNVYLNVGTGFETPTFTEIAYRTGASGPNLDLRAARSRHMELGIKSRVSAAQRVDLALFQIDTRDEIVTAIGGSRSVFTNAGKTRRNGMELAHSAQWSKEWRSYVALTTLNAKFVESFVTQGRTIARGNRIPGTMDRQLFAEWVWEPSSLKGLTAALEAVHRGSMMIDDRNSDRTDAATLLNLRLGWEQPLGAWRLRSYVRLDNVFDKAYVGSVIANESLGRSFESAPGRQIGAGVTLSYTY